MRTTIRNYEALYIVDPALSDEQIESIIARHSTVIADQGGEVKAAGKWEKRRLAYEIMGRREGIYILMFFDGEPAVAKELGRVFRIADDVVRHIITRVEPEHVDTTRIERPAPPPGIAAAQEPAEEAAAPVEEGPAAEEAAEAPVVEEGAAEETAPEEAPEEPAEETVPEEAAEEPAEETAPEQAAEEPAEETAPEVTAEEPAEETAEETAGASEEPEAEKSTEETEGREPKAKE